MDIITKEIIGLQLWMWVLLLLSIGLAGFVVFFGNNPQVQKKLKNMFSGKKDSLSENDVSDENVKGSQKTAEDFLEFNTIEKGMISFANDPNYFTMGFGVNGINISMYTVEDRIRLKSGFTSILNTLKDDTQFLVQSRYIDLSKNFDYYKPVIEANKNEADVLRERAKTEKSEVMKKKMAKRAEKITQSINYANHIIDFFNFYTRESKCISLNIFVVVPYRLKSTKWLNKNNKIKEAYNSLYNRVKILRDQFDSIGLKTYELDNIETANIIYSTLAKNESSYVKLQDAIDNGLLDLTIESIPGAPISDKKHDKYEDDYDFPHYEEVAVTDDEE